MVLARDYANYDGTDGKDKWKYCAPGSFSTNGYGLYDMADNVWEWCQDWYDSKERERVLRGGYWSNDAKPLRVDYRRSRLPDHRGNNVGFRCVAGLR